MLLRNASTLIFYLIYFFGICKSEHKNEEDEVIFQSYIEMDKEFKSMVSAGIKRTLPMLMEATDRLNLTAKCMGNILLLTTGIRKLKLSAIEFLDASGKPPAGILQGNMHMLGDYDQCLKSSMERRKGEVAFKGQYCLIHYSPLLPKRKGPVTFDKGVEGLIEATRNASEVVRFIAGKAHFFYYNPAKFGICVPSGCNEHDVEQVVGYVSEILHVNATLEYCDDDSDVFLDFRTVVFICCIAFIGALALFGTIVEYFSKRNAGILKSPFAKFLLCFSVLTNFPRAITTKKPENDISCLHGIRSLTLFYVIVLHQYYANIKYYITSHSLKALEEIPQFFFQIVANGFLTADVFFFISGLLNCYTRIKKKEDKTQKTNFFFIWLHRIIRIGPSYLFFSFVMSLFRPYGPVRKFQKRNYALKCDKYWWQNVFFINNYFFQDDTCSPHTWFIAAVMQLFILSLFTVPVLFKYPKRGIVVNCVVIIGGIITTVIWSWVNKVTPGIVFYRPNEDELNQSWNANTSTFPHIAPYFTGILMGYFLATKQNIKIPKMYQLVGWPIATLLFISMLFMTKVWNSGGAFTAVDSAFYFGFSKFLFVIAIAWMVLSCTTGNGGIINYILSLPLWIPIAKISYVTYLIAPFLQTFYFANSRMVVDFHRMPLIWRYAGDTAISCILGFVIYVLIEAPFLNIERLLFYRRNLLKICITPTAIVKNDIEEVKMANNELENIQKKDVLSSNQNVKNVGITIKDIE